MKLIDAESLIEERYGKRGTKERLIFTLQAYINYYEEIKALEAQKSKAK